MYCVGTVNSNICIMVGMKFSIRVDSQACCTKTKSKSMARKDSISMLTVTAGG